MAKKIVMTTVLTLAALAGPAWAADGMYLSVNAGGAIPQDMKIPDRVYDVKLESEIGYAGGGAVGIVSGPLRVEAEIEYQKSGPKQLDVASGAVTVSVPVQGDLTVTSGLINGYYSMVNTTKFTPFLTAGVGYAREEFKHVWAAGYNLGGDTEEGFAYQLGVGLAYKLSDTIALDLIYRYFVPDPDLKIHNILLALRYSF